MPDGFGYAPRLSQDIAKVVLSHVAAWIERDSLAVVFLGLIERTGPHVKIGELHETEHIFAGREGTELIEAHKFSGERDNQSLIGLAIG